MSSSSQVVVRQLNREDLDQFRTLRLRGLKEDPEAFGAAYEEISQTPDSDWLKVLDDSHGSFVLGAFDPNLVGLVAFSRPPRIKKRHKGHIWGMYVAPEARGCGIAKTLMLAALDRLRLVEELEEVMLTVVTKNSAARNLYLNLGFVPYGLEKRSLKLGDQYLDEELLSIKLLD